MRGLDPGIYAVTARHIETPPEWIADKPGNVTFRNDR